MEKFAKKKINWGPMGWERIPLGREALLEHLSIDTDMC